MIMVKDGLKEIIKMVKDMENGYSTKKVVKCTILKIILIGSATAMFGIIATAIGISDAMSIVPDITKIAPHILWNGLKTSLVTTYSGGIILLFSTVLWYFFSKKYKPQTL